MSDPSPPSLAALIRENEDLRRARDLNVLEFLKMARALQEANAPRAKLLAALVAVEAHARKVNWVNDYHDERILEMVRAAIANETGKLP
jgi:hypothetical protein